VNDYPPRFLQALDLVLAHEGGWSNHPKDRGRATMQGITLQTYRHHFGFHKEKADLRAIKREELEYIYFVGYWARAHCHELPKGLAYVVFDAAVNSGARRSLKWLQKAAGAKADGIVGPRTLAKVASLPEKHLIRLAILSRRKFLTGLKEWPTFGRGWTARINDVEASALVL